MGTGFDRVAFLDQESNEWENHTIPRSLLARSKLSHLSSLGLLSAPLNRAQSTANPRIANETSRIQDDALHRQTKTFRSDRSLPLLDRYCFGNRAMKLSLELFRQGGVNVTRLNINDPKMESFV